VDMGEKAQRSESAIMVGKRVSISGGTENNVGSVFTCCDEKFLEDGFQEEGDRELEEVVDEFTFIFDIHKVGGEI